MEGAGGTLAAVLIEIIDGWIRWIRVVGEYEGWGGEDEPTVLRVLRRLHNNTGSRVCDVVRSNSRGPEALRYDLRARGRKEGTVRDRDAPQIVTCCRPEEWTRSMASSGPHGIMGN